MGMCPARNNGNANASIAFTFAAIFSGSSPVPERYGPAMRIIRDVMGRRRWNAVELSGVRSKPDARGRCRRSARLDSVSDVPVPAGWRAFIAPAALLGRYPDERRL